MIPMVDLRRQYLSLKTEIAAAVEEVLLNTQFILGPNVSARQQESLTTAEACAAEVLSLPMFPELTDDEIRWIGDVINHVS